MNLIAPLVIVQLPDGNEGGLMAVRVATGRVESVVELPAQAGASRHSGFYQAQIERFSDFVFFNAPPRRTAYDVVVIDTRAQAV